MYNKKEHIIYKDKDLTIYGPTEDSLIKTDKQLKKLMELAKIEFKL